MPTEPNDPQPPPRFSQNPYQPTGDPYLQPVIVDPQSIDSEVKPTDSWNLGFVFVSWVVILSLCGLMAFLAAVGKHEKDEREVTKGDLMQANSAAKTTVGFRELFKSFDSPGLPSSARSLDSGPLEQRFCQAIVLNEIEGAEQALEYLDEIDVLIARVDFEMTEKQVDLRRSIRNLLYDYDEEVWEGLSLTDSEKEALVEHLGWCGRLVQLPALGPDKFARHEILAESQRTAFLTLVFFIGVIGLAFLGIAVFTLGIVLFFLGKLRLQLNAQRRNGDIYVETFAIWMALFLAFSIGISLMIRFGLPEILGLLAIFGSLVALVWPVIRGVGIRTMLEELGLTFANPIKEILCGIVAYIATLPFLGGAVIVVALLTAFVNQIQPGNELAKPSGPSHPIQEEIANSDSWLPMLQVILAACVVAPILEEIVFRGLLYRHKRELTVSWGLWLSIGFSTIVNGLLFAMIHPQGLLAIPILSTLAVAFCLAREWRGSLIAPMTMHAINNGMVTGLLFLLI